MRSLRIKTPANRPHPMARVFRHTALLNAVHKLGIFGLSVSGPYVVVLQRCLSAPDFPVSQAFFGSPDVCCDRQWCAMSKEITSFFFLASGF